MTDPTPALSLQPVLRDQVRALLDLDGDPSPRTDLAEFLMVLLATRGTLLLVDSSGRDLLRFAQLVGALEGGQIFHHYCTGKDTLNDLAAKASGKRVWFLEEIDSLKRDEQSALADLFLEVNNDDCPRFLIASVSSSGDSESLAEELHEALGAVVVLPKLDSARLKSELSSPRSRQYTAEGCSAEWSLLKESWADPYPADLVGQVVDLADKIASLDPTSVNERPPIDALRTQLQAVKKLGDLRAAYGEPALPLRDIPDIHTALLAHRLRRVDSEGKSNQMIVEEAVLKLPSTDKGGSQALAGNDGGKSMEDAKRVFLSLRNYMTACVIGRDKDGHSIEGTDLRAGGVVFRGAHTLRGLSRNREVLHDRKALGLHH
jgi:hypothetical protein